MMLALELGPQPRCRSNFESGCSQCRCNHPGPPPQTITPLTPSPAPSLYSLPSLPHALPHPLSLSLSPSLSPHHPPQANDGGDYFPVHGTCLGLETLSIVVRGGSRRLPRCQQRPTPDPSFPLTARPSPAPTSNKPTPIPNLSPQNHPSTPQPPNHPNPQPSTPQTQPSPPPKHPQVSGNYTLLADMDAEDAPAPLLYTEMAQDSNFITSLPPSVVRNLQNSAIAMENHMHGGWVGLGGWG